MSRPDNRLETAGLTPVSCSACAATVLVRKSTWDQTSVQWTAAALAVCRERTSAASGTDSVGRFAGCGALRESIREAAVSGELPIVESATSGPSTNFC